MGIGDPFVINQATNKRKSLLNSSSFLSYKLTQSVLFETYVWVQRRKYSQEEKEQHLDGEFMHTWLDVTILLTASPFGTEKGDPPGKNAKIGAGYLPESLSFINSFEQGDKSKAWLF